MSGSRDTVYKYRPGSKIWEEMPPMNTGRENFACGVVTNDDGKEFLFAVGGSGQSTELFDFESGQWSAGLRKSQSYVLWILIYE